MKTTKVQFLSVDEYIATFPEETRIRLETLRDIIKTATPDVEEKITYHMPTFNLNGKYLLLFAGWKKHIAIYGIPSTTLDTFDNELSIFKNPKGALLFPLNQPFPLELLERLVKFQVAEQRKTLI